jgi:hypothetical protein
VSTDKKCSELHANLHEDKFVELLGNRDGKKGMRKEERRRSDLLHNMSYKRIYARAANGNFARLHMEPVTVLTESEVKVKEEKEEKQPYGELKVSSLHF